MAVTYTRDGFTANKSYKGLSTDAKPTDGVSNGDSFYEMDTGALYMFDEDGKQWLEQ